MTAEEREKRKAERKRERQELHEQMAREAPLAYLNSYRRANRDECFTLILPCGDPTELKIHYRGDGWFEKDEQWQGHTARIPLFFEDPRELARLIRALVSRYNTMARSINEAVRETPPMEALESFPAQEGAQP